ncbi:hypothetical protein, partial [Echinicola sediminis]
MKKLAIIIAFGAFTLLEVQASPVLLEERVSQVLQDKIEILPEDLPQAVKDSIEEGETTKDLTIYKAYQLTDDEGNVIYKVKFGEGEDIITKNYDAEG